MADNVQPSLKDFLKLSKRANVIPVYRQILADFETPLSAYLKLEGRGPAYLLESVEQGERLGRYSFLGSSPSLILESRGREIWLKSERQNRQWTCLNDPLEELEKLMDAYRAVTLPGLPRFAGGWVGYLGYEMVRFLEPIGPPRPDHLNLPDSVWLLSDTVVIFDHIEHVLKVVANAFLDDGPAFPAGLPSRVPRLGAAGGRQAVSKSTLEKRARAAYQKATKRIEGIIRRLKQPLWYAPPVARRSLDSSQVCSNIPKADFIRAVGKAKRAIGQGQTIQIVLSQRFQVPVACGPFEIYRALRCVNPSPYMFYLNLGSFCLVGSSPEILVRCEDGQVENRPIAGTRPRGKTPLSDRQIEEGLKRNPKERAEHLMLADLGRNDIGRVCEYGSVKVNDLMTVERYSHVMHLVSSVTGKLSRGKSAFDVLRACFPAGTVTGAPKVRAMQLINELEPDARGPYAGCVGYVGFTGNLDTCITIRTILVKDSKAYVQAGAGIVADSIPAREFEETCSKAAGMLQAIRLAEAGLV